MLRVFRYDLLNKKSLPPLSRLAPISDGCQILMLPDQDQVYCVGQGSEAYTGIRFETAVIQGQVVPIKLHWIDTEPRTVWLSDSRPRSSNKTVTAGTKLVVRSDLYWGGLQNNNLYVESPATRYVGHGLLIVLPEDTPLYQPDREFDCYEALSFEQLERLYKLGAPYEPERPPLGPNKFNFRPDPHLYDFDINFDRDYMMFLINHATPEQLKSRAYHGPLCMFGIPPQDNQIEN